MQILMPIASHSEFFPKKEFYFPKPLIELVDRPMIDPVITSLKEHLPDSTFTFVALRDDIRDFSLDQSLKILGGEGTQIIEKLSETHGGLCSCLLAIDKIDFEEPLLICNSDQIIDAPIERYIETFNARNKDAGVLTFRSVHPRWAFAVTEKGGNVAQTFEKKVMSDQAIAGFYYFRRAGDFFEAAKQAILNSDSLDGHFYISAALNQIILQGKNLGYISFAAERYHSFYTPERVQEFNESPFGRRISRMAKARSRVNVVIPAAGEGSRFAKAGWTKKKPFIDVNGRPMLEHVIDNVVTEDYRTTLLLRKEHMESHQEEVENLVNSGASIIPVSELTEGTACTVLLARSTFDGHQPMMVANSDQLVDFDVADYVNDCLNRNLDGSILVFRDPTMNPKWSFARLNDEGLVVEVAEKKPISDLATVGIYLFRRGSDFVASAIDMIARNERVNGEFYTCPVYNYMIEKGLKIGVYEVPMDAMKGLGTPDDLTDYLQDVGAPASSSRPAS